jgi:hypothetical protein
MLELLTFSMPQTMFREMVFCFGRQWFAMNTKGLWHVWTPRFLWIISPWMQSSLDNSFLFLRAKIYIFTRLSPFLCALCTFFVSNNCLLNKRLSLFNWNLFYDTTHFQVISSTLTTLRHGMPITTKNVRLW